mmetsp:Transcript_4260/g.9208  ORF Transcript_4260/g.9208 Transcript_4260/m.9208 type:complete len:202 (+) Transcript_4260:134-739(+)
MAINPHRLRRIVRCGIARNAVSIAAGFSELSPITLFHLGSNRLCGFLCGVLETLEVVNLGGENANKLITFLMGGQPDLDLADHSLDCSPRVSTMKMRLIITLIMVVLIDNSGYVGHHKTKALSLVGFLNIFNGTLVEISAQSNGPGQSAQCTIAAVMAEGVRRTSGGTGSAGNVSTSGGTATGATLIRFSTVRAFGGRTTK